MILQFPTLWHIMESLPSRRDGQEDVAQETGLAVGVTDGIMEQCHPMGTDHMIKLTICVC
jgi:hypothetical protein